MSDIEIHHFGAAYALDALDERERGAYEAHFATCEICRSDVAELRQAAAELGSLSASSPSPDVKARVMAEIATTRQMSPMPSPVARLSDRRRAMSVLIAVAAAAILVLAGALVLVAARDDSFGDEMAAMMDDPSLTMVELVGPGEGAVKVMWTDDQAAVVGGELPDPGEGRRYELWMIDDAGAHAMGMLDPAEDGTVHRMMSIEGSPTGWGVTIEPESGSSTPTEPILFHADA